MKYIELIIQLIKIKKKDYFLKKQKNIRFIKQNLLYIPGLL